MFGFGKKKQSGIPVCHYEGISAFAQDYPCQLEVIDDHLEIRRLKPETTVTLPLNRVIQIDSMTEMEFMGKYHGAGINTAKHGIKHFLVITYQAQDGSEKYIALWGTVSEARKFFDLKMNFQKPLDTINL